MEFMNLNSLFYTELLLIPIKKSWSWKFGMLLLLLLLLFVVIIVCCNPYTGTVMMTRYSRRRR